MTSPILRQLAALRPTTDDELDTLVHRLLGLRFSRTPVANGSTAPFDYLRHAVFTGTDCVVWANRGGGKTLLGAVATLLDLLLTPGIQVRILGGSLEQSAKMHEHLVALLDRPALRRGVLADAPTRRRIALQNGSAVELLAQSHRSVRGTRVHKLRCDEVDEFKPDVWQAAQFVTRSDTLAGRAITGSIESFSTMHRPFGLMSQLVADAHTTRVPIFKWGALDVAQTCPPQRPCDPCPLLDDCQGRAKHARGHVPIDDLITQKRRASDDRWQSEILCRTPRRSHCVYPAFDPDRHVVTLTNTDAPRAWFAGMDFGVRNPTTFLGPPRQTTPPRHRPAPTHPCTSTPSTPPQTSPSTTTSTNSSPPTSPPRDGSPSIPPAWHATSRPASPTPDSSATADSPPAPDATPSDPASNASAVDSTAACSPSPPTAPSSSAPSANTTSTPNAHRTKPPSKTAQTTSPTPCATSSTTSTPTTPQSLPPISDFLSKLTPRPAPDPR